MEQSHRTVRKIYRLDILKSMLLKLTHHKVTQPNNPARFQPFRGTYSTLSIIICHSFCFRTIFRSDSLSQETTGLDPPSLARTSQYLKNHQDADRVRKSESKVAQAAEANTSGRGVIDDGAAAGGTTAA